MRIVSPGTPEYMTGYDGDTVQAIPYSTEVNFVPTTEQSQAVIFETVPGQSGRVVLYNVNNDALYLNQDRGAGGPVYVNTQAAIDSNNYIPIALFVRQDDTIIVQNLGQDAADPADDSSTIVLCPSQGPTYQMFAANNLVIPSDCTAQTLVAEFVVPDASTTSTPVSSPTPPPYVPPVGCPASSVQIPDGQQFRIRSTLYPDRWVFSQTQSTTTNIADAWIFTVTSGGTGQISTVSRSDGLTYDSQFVAYLTNNNGYSFFYRNADVTPSLGWTPLQFCLQPDNTFKVHSVGPDGPGADDANMAVICSSQGERVYFDNGDNLAYFAQYDCLPDTFVFEPISG